MFEFSFSYKYFLSCLLSLSLSYFIKEVLIFSVFGAVLYAMQSLISNAVVLQELYGHLNHFKFIKACLMDYGPSLNTSCKSGKKIEVQLGGFASEDFSCWQGALGQLV